MLCGKNRVYSIDIDFMDKGSSYSALPESTVIFICTFDPFGRGASKYTFTERCREIADLELHDGTLKVFFNTTYAGDDLPSELRALYDYIEQGKVKGSLTKKINEAVKRGRKNSVWRSQYMKERIILQEMKEEGIKEGERKGRREGERKGRREGERKGRREGVRKGRREGVRKGRREGTQKEKVRIITGMLERNMPLKDIADICSCSVKYVKEVESRMVDAGK